MSSPVITQQDEEHGRPDEVAVLDDAEVDGDGDGPGGPSRADAAPRTRPRAPTTAEEIDSTISRPGAVRINVKGAFIVDHEAPTPRGAAPGSNGRSSPTGHHETSDIRLPNHTAVVSHVAIDVSTLFSSPFRLPSIHSLTLDENHRLVAPSPSWSTSPASPTRPSPAA